MWYVRAKTEVGRAKAKVRPLLILLDLKGSLQTPGEGRQLGRHRYLGTGHIDEYPEHYKAYYDLGVAAFRLGPQQTEQRGKRFSESDDLTKGNFSAHRSSDERKALPKGQHFSGQGRVTLLQACSRGL